MTPINSIPDFNWSDTALEEMAITGEDIIARSDLAFQVDKIAIAGLIRESYLGPAWFWFALAEGVTIRHLLDFRRLKENIPIGALTAINSTKPELARFAVLYGFVDTGKSYEMADIKYNIFRRS